MKKTLIIILIIFASQFALVPGAYSQDVVNSSDTLSNYVGELKTEINELKKLKITGYIQAQAQFADSAGFSSFAGGNWNPNQDKRFMVRRGRLKFTYNGLPLNQFVIQIDVTEKGLSVKDAYWKFTEPWTKTISLTGGVFNRPIGFENEYSSGSRETPERSRFTQTLFPGERDAGFMLTIQSPKTSRFNGIKLDAALVNGNGITGLISDFDSYKDFIGHLSYNKSSINEKIRFGVGVSLYNGGFANSSNKVYSMQENNGVKKFTFNPSDTLTDLGARAVRNLKDFDAQISLDNPFGLTTLRGEYLFGQQSSGKLTTISPALGLQGDSYLRDVSAYYFYFVQNIGQSRHQLVIKYDMYDPNTKVSGKEIGASGANLTLADIKYNTLGIGWIYHWDSNIKFVVYYDRVKNESTLLSPFTKDIKDDVLTLRIQYKF